MSTVIGARRDRVWRALTTPDELVRWDERVLALVDPVSEYPRVGKTIRWRYLLGTIPIVAHDRPMEVVRDERLRTSVSLGLFRFDETYSLCTEPGDPNRTRITLKLVSSNSVPMVGGELDRFSVRRAAAEFVDGKLRSLQKWCEQRP